MSEIEPKHNMEQNIWKKEGGETDGKEENSQEGQMHGKDQGRQKVQKVRNGKRKVLFSSQETIIWEKCVPVIKASIPALLGHPTSLLLWFLHRRGNLRN
jgi:hypothetical protein